ncbi:MAG: hypothetical protein LBD62_04840 [Candidatus Margulisbacteria bacterium]|jgi:hypothetical protein|nr:hypothetical protein [Candidatus Margulisiibacteriota bacterium]
MRLLRKLIKFTEAEIASKFALDEIAAYDEVIKKSFAPVDKFLYKIDQPIFELTLIYPLKDDGLARRLLPWQEAIGGVLGDDARTQGHFYSGAEDLHMTLLCHTSRSHLLSEAHKQRHREAALKLFENRKEFFISPGIHFCGGCATKDAVIIHGYNFTELNRSRVALARYGLRRMFDDGHGYEFRPRLFDRKHGDEFARRIFDYGEISPNIAHLTLVRFRRPAAQEEQMKINELLRGVNFGETVFPELGLYEFSSFGVFSNSQRRAQLIFTGP